MLQAQAVMAQVISLMMTHWQQEVSEVYVCTSFVQAHRQYYLADAIDQPPVWPEVHPHMLLSHRLHYDHARQHVFPDIFWFFRNLGGRKWMKLSGEQRSKLF